MKKYVDYFYIDPRYYAAVTPELIQSQKVSWKNFFPHTVFVNLLEKIHEAVSRLNPKSLWLEGAYGSGKSHAALTIKSLFEAPDEDVEEYFRKYDLDLELCQKFLTDKNAGKIIVVHKIGSSSIHSDQDLILSIQSSIMNALETHGANKAENSLREAALKWLEKKANRDYIGQLIIEKQYFWDFYGKNIDEIISIIKNNPLEHSEKILSSLIKTANDNGVMAFRMDVHDLINWIKNVIEANNLKAILFIWDEFTEFFHNNPTSLTGFQTLVELSFSSPFYFLIVAHDAGGLFLNAESAKKILDRFIPPIKIDLPDNMAFKLMAQALQITDDPTLKTEWEKYHREINNEFTNARTKICTSLEHVNPNSFLLDNDLQAVIPIHPYAALMLKHLSVIFGSNQRSMFDFLINDEDESELHAFKWYIKNFGPTDQNYALTVDMLWDFFYRKDNNFLYNDERIVLNTYDILKPEALTCEEQRVLKTILLLQAFNFQNHTIDLLRPNDSNINLAFSGTNWPENTASTIAAKLVEKGLLFKRALSDGNFEYTIANTLDDTNLIKQEKDELIKSINTQTLIDRARLIETIFIPDEISDRFILRASSVRELQRTINEIIRASTHEHFYLIAVFALNDLEAVQVREVLPTIVTSSDVIFIDTSASIMGQNNFERYIETLAYSKYYSQKGDKQRAEEFQAKVQTYITNWKNKILTGSFVLYTHDAPQGKRIQDSSSLINELKAIDFQRYPCGLEHYNATTSIFLSKSRQFKLGAKCGITQKLTGQFLAPREDNSLDFALAGAWGVNNYWEDDTKKKLPIVQAKLQVESIIAENLAQPSGNVSVFTIYNTLKDPPFGFMPNNFTAFIMGFLLKEYSGENFFWSNGLKTEIMNSDKLAEAIFNVLNYDINPSRAFREEFITIMSQEQNAFLTCSSSAFSVPTEQCISIENVKQKIAATLQNFHFPLWCIKNIFSDITLKSNPQVILKAIEAYSRILEDDDAVFKIGTLVISSPDLSDDLANLLTEENCQKGFMRYIENFRDGILPQLASEIYGDWTLDTKFLNFTSSSLSQEKLDEKLNALILDYEIVIESNKFLPKSSSLSKTVALWIDAVNNLRVSFEAAQNYAANFLPFLENLYEILRFNNLPSHNRSKFLEALTRYRTDFEAFSQNQFGVFKIIAAPFLEGLTEPEIIEIFNALPTKQFMKPSSEYFRYVEAEIKNYKTGQFRQKLKDIWQKFTGTKDPADWSEHFDTPILCMISEQDRAKAKRAFEIVMKKSPTEAEVNFAMDFLETANFYDDLNNPQSRDKFFARNFLKDYRYVLPDPLFVRKKLRETSKEAPFYWTENELIQKRVKSIAEEEYKSHFRDKVFALIDTMDAPSLSKYVKALVAEKLNVGIEILKQQGNLSNPIGHGLEHEQAEQEASS